MRNQNEMLEALTYEAPQVEVIEVAVEKGYANSVEALSEEEWD